MSKRSMMLLWVSCTVSGACGSDSSNAGPGNGKGLPSCNDVCVGVVAAKCPAGPVDEADCLGGCQSLRSGKCAATYQSLFDCAGSSPTYTCDAGGAVTVVGCESANAALTTCASMP